MRKILIVIRVIIFISILWGCGSGLPDPAEDRQIEDCKQHIDRVVLGIILHCAVKTGEEAVDCREQLGFFIFQMAMSRGGCKNSSETGGSTM